MKSAARMGAKLLAFGTVVQVVEPDEGNEEYQGRTGLLITTLEADAGGLKRHLIAFEGERSLLRFYASELAFRQHEPPEIVEVVKYLPAPQSAVNVAVASELERIAWRYRYKEKNG